MKKYLLVALSFMPLLAKAEPTTAATQVQYIRPYLSTSATPTGVVYVQVAQTATCNTNVFRLDLAKGGGKEAYAALMMAMATGKNVLLETSSCTGWGSELQSVYVVSW